MLNLLQMMGGQGGQADMNPGLLNQAMQLLGGDRMNMGMPMLPTSMPPQQAQLQQRPQPFQTTGRTRAQMQGPITQNPINGWLGNGSIMRPIW